MIVLQTKADVRKLLNNMQQMRKLLGVTAAQQAQELGASACYVAARLSFPADAQKGGGGAKMAAKHKKKQDQNIRATVQTLFWDFDPARSNPAETMHNASEIIRHHDKGAKNKGKYVPSYKLAKWYSRHRNARPQDKESAIRSLQRWVGWGKAGWLNAMFKINKGAKQRVPAYVQRHVANAPSTVSVGKSNGVHRYTITNMTSQSGSLTDSALPAALVAAAKGQLYRYQKQTKALLIGTIKI